MGTAWGLVIIGAVLVYIASRPVQRARHNAAEARAKEPLTPAPQPAAPPVPQIAVEPRQKPQEPRSDEALTPQWLDSLIGSDGSEAPSAPASDPLDDAEGIASVLRLWLSEDSK
jgi:hypothetical protein